VSDGHSRSAEIFGGVALLAAAGFALCWANSPWSAPYFAFRRVLHGGVDDGLMTLFFLSAGLEIRRELLTGSLAHSGAAALAVLAAFGGVVVPAVIFLLFNSSAPARNGWAVPAATDIAFAVGVLALLGRRIPAGVRVLLLAVAMADDFMAIVVIAVGYSHGVTRGGLLLAAAALTPTVLLRRFGAQRPIVYLVPALILWVGLYHAHIEPAICGALVGLLAPIRPGFERLEARLGPWVAFGVMPLFALVNAGVDLGSLDVHDPTVVQVSLGIVLGLVVGKPIGILIMAASCVKLRFASLPADIDGYGLCLVSLLAGIGFTMATLMANLAFPDPRLLDAAKTGIVLGGPISAAAGLGFGYARFVMPARRAQPGL